MKDYDYITFWLGDDQLMEKRLNNKGYMLVEIIFASVLAMVVAYFIIDLTIK